MAIHFRATSYQAPKPKREGSTPDRWSPLEAPIGQAYVQAVEAHTAKLDLAAIAAAIVHRDIPAIVSLLELDALDTRLQMVMTAPILDAFEAGEEYGRSMIPGAMIPGAVKLRVVKAEASGLAYDFGVTNEAATAYATDHIGDLITHISSTQLDTVRGIVGGGGFGMGQPIDSLAKQIAGTVGLNAPQSAALAKYSNTLWGKTFEGNPKMSPVVQKKIDATQGSIDKYEQRLLRQRGEMIARTEVIRAETQGQLEIWKEGQKDGYVAADANKMVTNTMGACDICVEMAGEIIPIGDNYDNSEADGPPFHPNCRCQLALAPVDSQQTGAGAGTLAGEATPEDAVAEDMVAQAEAEPAEPTQQDNLDRLWHRGLITTEERDIGQVFLDQGKLPEILNGHNTFAYVTEINPDTGRWILRNVVTGEARASATKGIYTFATEKAALTDAGRQKFTVGTVDNKGYFAGEHLTPPSKGPIPFEKLTINDVRGWEPVEGYKGYNPGQWYQDPTSNRSAFLKQVASPDAAFNEVSVAKTYEALGAKPGIDIPNIKAFTDLNTGYVLSEKMVDITQYDKSVWTAEGKAPQDLRDMAKKFWAGDALTSNWDVVGNNPAKGYDNLLARTTPDGSAVTNIVRIDVGGGGRFRGVGSIKDTFTPNNDWVDPWTMRGQTRNSQSGSEQGKAVFGGITDKEAQTLLKQMATRLNATRLDALDTSLEKAGVTRFARLAYMDVIRARVEQVPHVIEMLKPERPLTGTISKGYFKVPAGQKFQTLDASYAKSEAQNIAAGSRVVNVNTIRDIKGNPRSFDSRDNSDIITYMTSGSEDINKYMRQDPNRRLSEDPKYKGRTEMLDEVFKISRSTDYFMVHTGQGYGDSARWKEGSLWTNWNTWSTSIGDRSDYGVNKPIQIHIEVPRGAPIVWAMPVSRYPSEREMLTPRGMVLEFSKITRDSLGKPKQAWARYVKYDPTQLPKGASEYNPQAQVGGIDTSFPPPTTGTFAPAHPNAAYPGATIGIAEADKQWLKEITGLNQPTAYDLYQAYLKGGLEFDMVKALTGFEPGQIGKFKMGTPEFAQVNKLLFLTSYVPVVTVPNPNYIYASTKMSTENQHILAAFLGGMPTASNLYHLYTEGTLQALVAEGKMVIPKDPNTGHHMTLAAWIKAVTGYTWNQIGAAPGEDWTLKPL